LPVLNYISVPLKQSMLLVISGPQEFCPMWRTHVLHSSLLQRVRF